MNWLLKNMVKGEMNYEYLLPKNLQIRSLLKQFLRKNVFWGEI